MRAFLASGLDYVSSQLHTLATLTPRNEPRYLLNRWLSGSQSLYGHSGKEKSPLPLSVTEPRFLTLPAGIIVNIPAKLCQFL